MLVEGKMSNVGGRLFGMVMWVDFLRLLFFLDSSRLGGRCECKSRDGDGGRDGCADGCEGGLTQSLDTVGKGDCISVVVTNGVGMIVGGGGEGNRGKCCNGWWRKFFCG